MKIKDKVWVWGQPAGIDNLFMTRSMPKQNQMTPMEFAYYMGTKNVFQTISWGIPRPPFCQDSMALETMDNVIWSALGDSASGDAEYIDEIAALARENKNIKGVVLQDILQNDRRELFYPDTIREMKARLIEKAGRNLEIWATIFDRGDSQNEIRENLVSYFEVFDGAVLWHGWEERTNLIEENVHKLQKLAPHIKIYLGIYTYMYAKNKVPSTETMQLQISAAYKLLCSREIEGVVIHSNTCADMGFDSVETMRRWMKQHGDEELFWRGDK